jgi:hypothetical protein
MHCSPGRLRTSRSSAQVVKQLVDHQFLGEPALQRADAIFERRRRGIGSDPAETA